MKKVLTTLALTFLLLLVVKPFDAHAETIPTASYTGTTSYNTFKDLVYTDDAGVSYTFSVKISGFSLDTLNTSYPATVSFVDAPAGSNIYLHGKVKLNVNIVYKKSSGAIVKHHTGTYTVHVGSYNNYYNYKHYSVLNTNKNFGVVTIANPTTADGTQANVYLAEEAFTSTNYTTLKVENWSHVTTRDATHLDRTRLDVGNQLLMLTGAESTAATSGDLKATIPMWCWYEGKYWTTDSMTVNTTGNFKSLSLGTTWSDTVPVAFKDGDYYRWYLIKYNITNTSKTDNKANTAQVIYSSYKTIPATVKLYINGKWYTVYTNSLGDGTHVAIDPTLTALTWKPSTASAIYPNALEHQQILKRLCATQTLNMWVKMRFTVALI